MTRNLPRTLPHSLDAEASVLGGVMLRPDLIAQLDTLEPAAFFDARHQVVFEAMRNLEATGRPLDVVTLEHEVERQGKLDAIGGVAFLGELLLRVPTADNVIAYAEIVLDKHRARRLMLAASDILERGYESHLDVDEYFSGAMAAIARIDRSRPDQIVTAGALVKRRLKEIEQIIDAKSRGEAIHIGAPSGIAELDKRIGGLPFGDVTLLAARPAMGKTSQAMAAVDATTAAGLGAIVFSQEGGWRQYADRLIARGSGISVERIRSGDLQGSDSAAIGQALLKFHLRPNWLVDDRAGLSAAEIVRSVRRWKAKLNLKLVVVDYIQILKLTRGLSENDALNEAITTFSHAALADDVSYLVLCQLNREVEKRDDKRPRLSDLRGSGALEERPRVILSPYRGSYYYDEPKKGIDWDCSCLEGAPCSHEPTSEQFKAGVQILILKNNNGQSGYVTATWRGATTEMS